MSTGMDFRVLGPVEVWDGNTRLALGSARQQAVLGTLLLRPDQVVAADRLAAAVWGEAPPEETAGALRTHVAALRKVLEPSGTQGAPSMLVAGETGYRLHIDPERVDAHRFERLVERGRRAMDADPVTGSALLHRAASLWRGPALAGITLGGDAAAECARLDQLRVTAVEDRLHADLELGRHAAVVGELDVLVAVHPLRERLHAQRVLALHRCGRRADALAAYQDAARQLEPSADLRSLEQAILADDPALAAPAPAADNTVIGTIVPRTQVPVAPAPAPAAAPTPAPAAKSGAKTREPVKAATRPIAASAPPPATRRPQRHRTLVGVATLVLCGSVAGGLAVHSQRASASPQAPAAEAFPNQQERMLIARFDPAVSDCHRYPLHYASALADVECRVRADHPGASTLLLQSFADDADLEMHFHHVLALTIQEQTGRPVTAAYNGDCADPGSGFFALANHRRANATTANGHLMCYGDRAGVSHLAWTDVSRLTVAQAAGGPGSPADAQAGLMSFWRNLYSDETVYPKPADPVLTAAAPRSTPAPAAVEQVAQGTSDTGATQSPAVSRPPLAPTPSATPAPAPAGPARTGSTARSATPAPSPAASHPAAGGHGDGGDGSWEDAWHHVLAHGHD